MYIHCGPCDGYGQKCRAVFNTSLGGDDGCQHGISQLGSVFKIEIRTFQALVAAAATSSHELRAEAQAKDGDKTLFRHHGGKRTIRYYLMNKRMYIVDKRVWC